MFSQLRGRHGIEEATTTTMKNRIIGVLMRHATLLASMERRNKREGFRLASLLSLRVFVLVLECWSVVEEPLPQHQFLGCYI